MLPQSNNDMISFERDSWGWAAAAAQRAPHVCHLSWSGAELPSDQEPLILTRCLIATVTSNGQQLCYSIPQPRCCATRCRGAGRYRGTSTVQPCAYRCSCCRYRLVHSAMPSPTGTRLKVMRSSFSRKSFSSCSAAVFLSAWPQGRERGRGKGIGRVHPLGLRPRKAAHTARLQFCVLTGGEGEALPATCAQRSPTHLLWVSHPAVPQHIVHSNDASRANQAQKLLVVRAVAL